MANASARNIAQAPTLRSGSPSNLRVRCSRRTAESRYLPRLRLAPAGRSPQGEAHGARHPTVVCRHAAGVAVEYESPVTRDTHPIPSRCAPRSTGEVVLGNPQSVAKHSASYTAWVFRSTSSSENLRDRAKDYGARMRIHATFLPPMLQT